MFVSCVPTLLELELGLELELELELAGWLAGLGKGHWFGVYLMGVQHSYLFWDLSLFQQMIES